MTFRLEEPGNTNLQLQVGDPVVQLTLAPPDAMQSAIVPDQPPEFPDVLDGGTF